MMQNTDKQNTSADSKQTLHKKMIGIAAAAIVLAAVCAFLLPNSQKEIILPDGSGTAGYHDVVTEQTEYRLTDTDITTDNVQQVIESLARPSAYIASITNTLYWDDKWDEIQAVQYVRDGVSLTQYNDAMGNAERFEAVHDGKCYAWRNGSKTQYSGAAGTVSSDDISMIPTYETVVQEEKAAITEAGLRTVSGVPCIYVTVADSKTGYQLTYWISTVNGLLIQADYTKGSTLVRSVVMNDIRLEMPSESLFTMPNGTSLLP